MIGLSRGPLRDATAQGSGSSSPLSPGLDDGEQGCRVRVPWRQARHDADTLPSALQGPTGAAQNKSHMQSSRATRRPACAVQVWCPSEEGEWKGLSKGRAVRSMQFKVKLQRDIRKRNKHLKVS